MYAIASEKFSHCTEEDFLECSDIKSFLLELLPDDYYQDVTFYSNDDIDGSIPQHYSSNSEYIDDTLLELDAGIIVQFNFNGQFYTVKSVL